MVRKQSEMPGFELCADSIGDVFAYVERATRIRLDRSTVTYGNHGHTIGARTKGDMWVRCQWRPLDKINDISWIGVKSAPVLADVAMPQLFRSLEWRDNQRQTMWRADEMQLIASKTVSSNGSVTIAPELSDRWWSTLTRSLENLGRHTTERVSMTQEHLTRRLTEAFPSVTLNSTVTEWTTAHADLHWGNLTAPECYLLDWENWGRAPRGYDAATLWGFSLGVPRLAERVAQEFRVDLETRPGRLSQLLFCANVLRQFAKRGVIMPFTQSVRAAAPILLDQLSD